MTKCQMVVIERLKNKNHTTLHQLNAPSKCSCMTIHQSMWCIFIYKHSTFKFIRYVFRIHGKWDEKMENIFIISQGNLQENRKILLLSVWPSECNDELIFFLYRRPSFKPPRHNIVHCSLKEDEIGITEYVTPTEGFTGIIKQRFVDSFNLFIVRTNKMLKEFQIFTSTKLDLMGIYVN